MLSVQITGLNELAGHFDGMPEIVERIIGKALTNSIAMVETNAAKLTPVDTGYLRSSIGGEGGYKYVRGLTAGVGTNVKYAAYVEYGNGKHRVGQSRFMEGGVNQTGGYIEGEFKKAMVELSEYITKK